MYDLLLVEDDPVSLKGTRLSFENSRIPVGRITTRSDPGSAIELVSGYPYDLLVADVRFRDSERTGFEVMQAAQEETGIMTLTYHPKYRYVKAAEISGADAYVVKGEDELQVISAAQEVLTGGTYLSDQLSDYTETHVRLGEGSLRPSYYDALLAIANTTTVQEAADEMNISVNTMYTYRSEIAKQLGLSGAEKIDDVARLIK